MAMIASVPPMMALGRFRCGSFTSPPTRDRSPNPSYAHSTLTSARPRFPAVMVAPIAGVRWANVPPCWPPSSSDAMTIAPRAANFTTVETLDNRRADPGADDVGGGGEGNGSRRERPRRGRMRHGIDAERPQEILAEDDGNPAERGGTNDDELGPAEQKRGRAAPALAKIRVEPTALGQSRGQFGERQRPAQGDGAAQHPQAEHHRRARHQSRDAGRRAEDAGADRDADDEGDAAPEPERARQTR